MVIALSTFLVKQCQEMTAQGDHNHMTEIDNTCKGICNDQQASQVLKQVPFDPNKQYMPRCMHATTIKHISGP